MGLLDSLFGGGPRKAQEQQAAMSVAAPVTPEQERLSALLPSAPAREGLIRGKTFGAGSTLGNIIGTLGDAFLVGQGRRPIYQDRLARKNEADALNGFTDDPLGAIKRLAQVSPDKATALYDRYMDNERLARSEKRLEDQVDFAQREKAHTRSVGMLGAANEKTYGPLKARVDSYRAQHGLPPLELPDTYDPDAIKMARYSAIDPDDQQRMEDQAEWRDTSAQYREDNLAERQAYHEASVAEREASRRQRAALGEASLAVRREANSIRGRNQKPQPKVVQTKDGAFRFSADRSTAGHVDAKGVRTKLIQVGGKWKAIERIIPGPEGDTHVILVGDKWVKKEPE